MHTQQNTPQTATPRSRAATKSCAVLSYELGTHRGTGDAIVERALQPIIAMGRTVGSYLDIPIAEWIQLATGQILRFSGVVPHRGYLKLQTPAYIHAGCLIYERDPGTDRTPSATIFASIVDLVQGKSMRLHVTDTPNNAESPHS